MNSGSHNLKEGTKKYGSEMTEPFGVSLPDEVSGSDGRIKNIGTFVAYIRN